MSTSTKSKKRKFQVPHTYFILFVVVIICVILTWIVPSGTYETAVNPETGASMIDPDSFHYTESSPVGFFDLFKAFHTGMVKSGSIIFFIFIIGGAFTIVQETGVLDAAVGKLVDKLQHRKTLLLLLLMFAFSVLGATMGLAEEVIIFIPIAVALCKRLKLDAMVALSVTMVGSRIGFTTGMANPFTLGVAQGLCDLPLYSGFLYRSIWYLAIFAVTAAYTFRYIKKIEKNPAASIMHGIEAAEPAEPVSTVKFTPVHTVILLEILAIFIVMFYGIFKYEWYMTELAALFLIMGLLAGITARMAPNVICKSFVSGTKDMAFAALVVGVARAVLVVLEDGAIIDTIIHGASSALIKLPTIVAANGMYIFQLLLNFLIPSGSGQAAATIPIMAPIADILGITRQTAVLAFHYGDGFTNLAAPTVGALMASLGVAGVPYDRYLKWIMPLLTMWVLLGVASVSIAAAIQLGPF